MITSHSYIHIPGPCQGQSQGSWQSSPSRAAPRLLIIFSRLNHIFIITYVYAMHKKRHISQEHFGEKQLGYIPYIQRHRAVHIGFLCLIYFAGRNLKVFGIGGFLWTNFKPPGLLRKVQPSFDMPQHTHNIASALDMQREKKKKIALCIMSHSLLKIISGDSA